MKTAFTDLVEEIKKLPHEEKEEIRFLLEKYLTEERREEILKNSQKSLKEFSSDKLEFSNDINKLKGML